MANARTSDMTQGPVFGHMLRLFVPMSFAILAFMAVGVIDTYWMGKLGVAQQAAGQMAWPVIMFIMSFSIGLGAGTVSVVSRAAGRKDGASIPRLCTDAMILAFLVVAVVSVLGVLLIDPVFRLMGASDVVMPHVRDFMQIYFAGTLFAVVPMIASNVLRAQGHSFWPSMLMLVAAFVNMALDPLLIFGWGPFPEMGVQGAALATVISNMITASLMFGLLVKEKLVSLALPKLAPMLEHWAEVTHVGIPAAASNMINPMALFLTTAAAAMFGDAAIAGFGAARGVEMFTIVPFFALSAVIGILTGQNGGAGITDRVRESFRKAFLFCAAWSGAMAALLWVFSPYIARLMLPAVEAQDVARTYWAIVPITVGGYGIAMAASAGFNGLGRPINGIAINFVRCLVLVAPLAWLGAFLTGIDGVIYGVAAGNALTGIGASIYVLRFAPMSATQRKRKAAAPTAPSEGESVEA
ncbi:MATE family efflux transporter [Woodsholea maritima]|uniref:MATE family efflux transporter n=1 Tax=Woodsholea maritima TaxID=240237 RepID=UPI00068670C4|nr:MATE family efflux transporter [Woodsholea maritima]